MSLDLGNRWLTNNSKIFSPQYLWTTQVFYILGGKLSWNSSLDIQQDVSPKPCQGAKSSLVLQPLCVVDNQIPPSPYSKVFFAYKPSHPLAEIWQDPVNFLIALLLWFCKVGTTDFPLIEASLTTAEIIKVWFLRESWYLNGQLPSQTSQTQKGWKKFQQNSAVEVIPTYRFTA